MNMKKKTFLMGVAVACAALVVAPVGVSAQEAVEDEEAVMTHGQLAQLLVRRLGLVATMAPNPTDMECMMMLSMVGIFPSASLTPTVENPTPGWSMDPSTPVTLAELAVVLVRALGLEGQVEGDKNDPQNWVNALQDVNVPVDSVQGGMQSVVPLPQIVMSISIGATSIDPLRRVFVSDSRGGVVLDTISFPSLTPNETEQKMQGEGKPRPVTPT